MNNQFYKYSGFIQRELTHVAQSHQLVSQQHHFSTAFTDMELIVVRQFLIFPFFALKLFLQVLNLNHQRLVFQIGDAQPI